MAAARAKPDVAVSPAAFLVVRFTRPAARASPEPQVSPARLARLAGTDGNASARALPVVTKRPRQLRPVIPAVSESSAFAGKVARLQGFKRPRFAVLASGRLTF